MWLRTANAEPRRWRWGNAGGRRGVRAPIQGNLRHLAGQMGTLRGLIAGALFTLAFAKWRGQNAKMGVNPGSEAQIVAPWRGARTSRSLEHIKRTTSRALQLEAFAGRDLAKKGGESG